MTEKSILVPSTFFQSYVYTISKPEFLDSVLEVANESLEVTKKQQPINETYPSVMSIGMMGNPKIHDFEQFIAQSGWTIMDNQGYDMNGFNAYVNELWCQEHRKFSGMEQHTHHHGVVISGFYFLEVPADGCMIQFHDPRVGKVQSSLPEKDNTKITEASNSFFMKPEAGQFVFSNSWLPHSFTRNSSDQFVKFIHFNISVTPSQLQQPVKQCAAPAEVV